MDEFIAGLSFFLLLGIAAITVVYPYGLKTRKARVLLHLPLLLPILYKVEYAFEPARYNIRLELVFMQWAMSFAALFYFAKLIAFYCLPKAKE